MPGVSIGISLSAPDAPSDGAEGNLRVEINAVGTLSIVYGEGTLELTVSGTARFDGVYNINTDDLDAGPLNLVAPDITGVGEPGQTLNGLEGLWVYKDVAQAPDFAYQWLRDGVPIPGAVSADYLVVPSDQGTNVSLRQTATDANGSREALSSDIAVSGNGQFNDTFDAIPDGTSLSSLPDYSEFQNSAGDIVVQGGRAVIASPVTDVTIRYVGSVLPDDQFVEVELATLDVGTMDALIYTRHLDDNNWILAKVGAGAVSLSQKVGGSFATLSGNFSVAAGDVLRLECEGTEVRLLQNGSLLTAYPNTTLFQGTAGLRLRATNPTVSMDIERFSCGGI